MINQDIIAQDLFYKIRSRFPKMEMGDNAGNATFESAKGRFFDFDANFNGQSLGSVSISINEPGSLKLYFNRNILEDADDITSKTWYNFLKEMRKFAMKRLMSFDTRDISKTNLDKRDFSYLANKGNVMSESSMRGTSRTSYKPLQKTKLIIRHSKPVDESIPGARSRNIESLFIENAIGERFKYPFPHKIGAEAMQRHVANEGLPHDPVGQKIIEMSADIAKLTSFKKYVYKEDLMNSETNHIVDRANHKLQSLKELMHRLTRQPHYDAFKSSVLGSMGSDQQLIDDITLEEYKEKFTKKSFKEDIADVFPLLFSIMHETSELDLEEVAQTEDQYGELSLESVLAVRPTDEFDNWATTLIETQLSPDDLDNLKSLVSEHFPVGVNGTNVSSALEELGFTLPNDVKQSIAQLAEQAGPDADASQLVIEYLSSHEPEIFGAMGMEQQELAEGQALVINGKEVDASSLEIDGVDTRDTPDFSDAYFSAGTFTDGTEMSDDELDQLRDERGDLLHELVWDSLHEVQQPMQENGEQTPEERKAANDYAMSVARAIKSGEVQPEEIEQEFFYTLPMMGVSDEKVAAMWSRMTGAGEAPRPKRDVSDADIDAELRGMKGNDEDDDAAFLNNLRSKAKSGSIKADDTGFGSEVDEAEELERDSKDRVVEKPSNASGMKKIAEFIMGFYDRKTGNFPLGETGVQIKVEKEFGENAGNLARQLIEKLAQRGGESHEVSDLTVLSGQHKAQSTMAQPPIMESKIIRLKDSDFADIMKLAGLKK